MFNPLYGIRFIESSHMTIPKDEVVKRTWRERLFTRPWQPLRATKTIVRHVPNPDVVQIGNTIYGHPETIAKAKRAIENQYAKSEGAK